jgi:pimeloyl-ACP methyl ester carboxylesterase
MQASPLFDNEIAPPHPFLMALESRVFMELAVFALLRPFLGSLPRGDGHAVLVVPGFVQDELAVTPLRQTLRRMGYEAHIWDQGRNLGFSKAALASLRAQARRLAEVTRRKVSVIGWSLGGVFARELAFEIPDQLRLVITLGSPFGRNPHASSVRWLYELINRHRADEIDDEMVLRIRRPLPVPSTAIYSRSDGIVSWQTCIDDVICDTNENIEVVGSHSGMGFNAQVLWIIADRLAQPSGTWKPMSSAREARDDPRALLGMGRTQCP